MSEPLRLALRSVRRRWRRNSISLVVIAAGVGALVILSSLSIGSSEAVTRRLDSVTNSRITALLPQATWNADETELLSEVLQNPQVTSAGTLVSPDRTGGSAVITNPRSSRTVESSVGIATPSGLRSAAVTVRSGGIGADMVVAPLPNAVYLGARIARELDYPDIAGGQVTINGQQFSVLGILASEEAWISASVVFPPAAASAAGYLPNNRILAITIDGEMTPPLQDWLALALSPTQPDAATILSAPSAQELRAEILERGNSLTGLIGVIAALTGFLTLAATTFASLTERRREMGLYLALGYGRSFVSGQIVTEGLIVGLLGGIFGFLIGAVLSATISLFSFPSFYFPPSLILLPAVAGVLGFFSALLPALAATRVAPSELLRD